MLYSIGKFSKMIGRSTRTLRLWSSNGKLIPAHISLGKHRMYSDEQLSLFVVKPTELKINVGYARVSSKKQIDDLNRQTEMLELYLTNKSIPYKIITDVGSGINYNKKGLLELFKMINRHEIDTLCILYKDRLVRFGIEIIESFCSMNNVKLEIINQTDKTNEEELVDDILNIIHIFSCKLNGKRSHINKKIIEQLKVVDDRQR